MYYAVPVRGGETGPAASQPQSWAHLPLPHIEQAFRACARLTSSAADMHAAADARLRAMTGA